MSRRTLAKTAVWAAPAAALAITAPAVAASRCTSKTLNWTSFPTSAGKRDGTVTIGDGTATLSRTVITDHAETFTTDGSQRDFLRLRSQASRSNPATTNQTLILKFSMDVHDLRLTIYDLDRDLNTLSITNFEDRVRIHSQSPFTKANGANVIGSGTAADPFRASPAAGNGNAEGAPTQRLSESFKVDLHWPFLASGSQIVIEYFQGAWKQGVFTEPTPTIWISNPTFCA